MWSVCKNQDHREDVFTHEKKLIARIRILISVLSQLFFYRVWFFKYIYVFKRSVNITHKVRVVYSLHPPMHVKKKFFFNKWEPSCESNEVISSKYFLFFNKKVKDTEKWKRPERSRVKFFLLLDLTEEGLKKDQYLG